MRIWIEHLPQESATKTALRNAVPDDVMAQASNDYRPDKAQWSRVETLLVELKDELTLNRLVAIAAAGGKPGEFTPTPRPGVPPKSATRKGLTDEQRRAIDPRLRNQPKEA
ncbi:hypothetical protein OG554_03710 [Streptomyces griseus]|uniref:hypothetical protein n=1 Tax=Streptomyces griseus TaxID=1911 RepID=UPI00386D666E|nr:hypothetical protein OG554_03710 [Streptomyces fimicarius]